MYDFVDLCNRGYKSVLILAFACFSIVGSLVWLGLVCLVWFGYTGDLTQGMLSYIPPHFILRQDLSTMPRVTTIFWSSCLSLLLRLWNYGYVPPCSVTCLFGFLRKSFKFLFSLYLTLPCMRVNFSEISLSFCDLDGNLVIFFKNNNLIKNNVWSGHGGTWL